MSALRASYFFTDFKKNGAMYTFRFSTGAEIDAGRTKKRERSIRCSPEFQPVYRSPRTSPSTAIPPDTMQIEQDGGINSDVGPNFSNACVADECSINPSATENIQHCTSGTSKKELSTLKHPPGMSSAQGDGQGNVLHSTVEDVINTDAGCSSVLIPESVSADADTDVRGLNESVNIQITESCVNDMDVVTGKPGVNTPVFTDLSRNVDFENQTTPTDVAMDSSNSVNVQNNMPSPNDMEVFSNNRPASAKMDESFSRNVSSILDNPPQSETFSEPQAALNNLQSNLASGTERFHAMKEALNISLGTEEMVADGQTSATLPYESSPLEAYIAYGSKGIIQGQLPQLHQVTVQNAVQKSSEAFCEDKKIDSKMLLGDSVDICDGELDSVLTAEVDEKLIKNVCDELFPNFLGKDEDYHSQKMKIKPEKIYCDGSTCTVPSYESKKEPKYAIYVDDTETMKDIVEALSGVPGLASMKHCLQEISAGDLSCSMVQGNYSRQQKFFIWSSKNLEKQRRPAVVSTNALQ